MNRRSAKLISPNELEIDKVKGFNLSILKRLNPLRDIKIVFQQTINTSHHLHTRISETENKSIKKAAVNFEIITFLFYFVYACCFRYKQLRTFATTI